MKRILATSAVALAAALFFLGLGTIGSGSIASAQDYTMRRVRQPKDLPAGLQKSLDDKVSEDAAPYLDKEDREEDGRQAVHRLRAEVRIPAELRPQRPALNRERQARRRRIRSHRQIDHQGQGHRQAQVPGLQLHAPGQQMDADRAAEVGEPGPRQEGRRPR